MNSYGFAIISSATILYSIILRNNNNKISEYIGIAFTVIFGFYISLFFVSDYFTGNGIDESVFYHLRYGLIGAGFAEYAAIISIFSIAIIIYILIIALFTYNKYLRKNRPNYKKLSDVISHFLLIISFILCPTSYSLFKHYGIDTVFMRAEKIHAIDDYLIVPDPAPIRDKKNILYIYAESLERTYFDNDAFPGLITGLRQIEDNSLSFTNIRQIRSTGWTIAGITASQCGIPLVTPSGGNSMSGMDTFLPKALCLGDILSEQNYQLEYLSGSSIEFSGTRKFFATHGFDEIDGRNSLRKFLPDRSYQNGWGLYDDTVLDIAYRRFDRLSNGDKPFGLFVSTMDTHHPNGHPSRSCKGEVYRDGSNPMLNAVLCSDSLISDFIQKILESPHAEKTLIVLSSDHLAMSNSSATHLLDDMERRNLLLMIDPKGESRKLDKAGSMMDVTPTIMHLLGYEMQLGLGRNLLGDEEPLVTRLHPIDDAIASWKDSLIQFWNFPKIGENDRIAVYPETLTVAINDRVFKIPILIELDAAKNVILKFSYDSHYQNKNRLMDYVVKLDPGTTFLWLDECMIIWTVKTNLWGDYCALYGEAGTANVRYENLYESFRISPDEILNGRADTDKRTTVADSLARDRIIAHAGGGIDNNKYTNSMEALDLSYENGFKLFELDILSTSDGFYVAAHDWESWRTKTNFGGQLPPSRAEFLSYKILNRYTPMDMERINNWFRDHPEAILVTDKVNSPHDFSEKFVDKSRLIMELFSIEAFKGAKLAGIKSAMPSWNMLSQFKKPILRSLIQHGVTEIAASRKVLADSMPFVKALKRSGIRVYLFHLDASHDESYIICNKLLYVYGFYSDFLSFSDEISCAD